MADVPVSLGPVQKTLLVPLLGRAVETRRPNGLINDPRAVEIVEQLDFDFSAWEGKQSLLGASIRTRMFDNEVAAFLAAHPEGTVVEIGCGLNTRYERLDNGRAHWIEIDLPDSMALRQRFFSETPRRTMIAASALETGWLDTVEDTGGPWCFVAEAVIIYLEPEQVEALFRRLAEWFPGARLITDTTSTQMVDHQDKHDVMKTFPRESWFRWRCDDPAALSAWGARLDRSRSFLDAPPPIRARMPLSYRLVMGWAPWLIRRKVDGYRINTFTLTPEPA